MYDDIIICKCGEIIMFINGDTQVCPKCNEVHIKNKKIK